MERFAPVSAMKRSRTVPVGGGGSALSSAKKQIGLALAVVVQLVAGSLVGIGAVSGFGALVGVGSFLYSALAGIGGTLIMLA